MCSVHSSLGVSGEHANIKNAVPTSRMREINNDAIFFILTPIKKGESYIPLSMTNVGLLFFGDPDLFRIACVVIPNHLHTVKGINAVAKIV